MKSDKRIYELEAVDAPSNKQIKILKFFGIDPSVVSSGEVGKIIGELKEVEENNILWKKYRYLTKDKFQTTELIDFDESELVDVVLLKIVDPDTEQASETFDSGGLFDYPYSQLKFAGKIYVFSGKSKSRKISTGK